MKRQNGEINFLRFVFAIIVMILHFEDNYDFKVFECGYISVEFYFMVSGYLMAKRVKKRRERSPLTDAEIGSETWSFLGNKIKSFYGYYLMSVVLWLVILQVGLRGASGTQTLNYVMRGMPQLTLTFMGICHDYTGLYVANSWYLSAMVLAMLILYPLLLKKFDTCTKFIFPLVSIFLLGYLYKSYNSICATFQWNGFFYGGLLRGIAEIALGASLFTASEFLTSKHEWLIKSKKAAAKWVLTAIKWLCYGITIIHAYGFTFGGAYSVHALFFCAIGVMLSFSEAGYMIPDNKVTRYLGKISLPVYIFHGVFRYIARTITGLVTIPTREIVIMIVTAFVLSVALMYLTDFITNGVRKGYLAFRAYVEKTDSNVNTDNVG